MIASIGSMEPRNHAWMILAGTGAPTAERLPSDLMVGDAVQLPRGMELYPLEWWPPPGTTAVLFAGIDGCMVGWRTPNPPIREWRGIRWRATRLVGRVVLIVNGDDSKPEAELASFEDALGDLAIEDEPDRRCEHMRGGADGFRLEIEYRLDEEWEPSPGSPRFLCSACLAEFLRPANPRRRMSAEDIGQAELDHPGAADRLRRAGHLDRVYTGWRWTVTA